MSTFNFNTINFAQQGALFLVKEDDEKDKFIELSACYAFERKKFVNKRIEIGEGLIGQAYLEGLSTYLFGYSS